MNRTQYAHRPGLTLIELIVCLVATSLLLFGMSAAIFLAARAAEPDSLASQTLGASLAAEELAEELSLGLGFPERSAEAVTFLVHRYGGQQTIRYVWSGVPGEPLLRQYNSEVPVERVQPVHEFQLLYHVETAADREVLRRIEVILQISEDPATRVHHAVEILNAPEVISL